MPLQSPKLDDRDFNALFAELKKLIPRYSPEWTDHNDSDPGITLLQLFAYLGDLMIYRLNQVPDKNYVEFLRLIGVQLQPAAAASTLLTFTLAEGADTAYIPAGTQVQGDGGGEDPLVFETQADLLATESALKRIATGPAGSLTLLGDPPDGYPVGMAPDGASFTPFGDTPVAGMALYLGFSLALSRGQDLKLHLIQPEADPDELGPATAGGWVGPATAANQAPAALVWEYLSGGSWQALDRVIDTTAGLTRTGEVRFRVPGSMDASDLELEDLVVAEETCCWLRVRLEATEYETPPRLRAVLPNSVTAAHAATIASDVMGRSDGEPGQTFTLRYPPALAGTLELAVEEDGEMVAWTEVSDFFASEPADRHYTLDPATGTVTFGDGSRGRIPANRAAIEAVTYKQGGGTAGNVAALTLTSLRSSLTRVQEVTNPLPATGGDDTETLAAAMARAPRELRTFQRAVTQADYEAHALAAPGGRVARARVLPLTHPDFPGVSYPGTVTVVVVPYSEEPRPWPATATLQEVRNYLETVRTITAEVYVAAPKYRQVSVTAEIGTADGADPGAVQDACLATVDSFFHALTGGRDGTGWPWGGTIYFSDVMARLMELDGVRRVYGLTIRVDGQEQDQCADVELQDQELTCPGEHTITIRM